MEAEDLEKKKNPVEEMVSRPSAIPTFIWLARFLGILCLFGWAASSWFTLDPIIQTSLMVAGLVLFGIYILFRIYLGIKPSKKD